MMRGLILLCTTQRLFLSSPLLYIPADHPMDEGV